MERGPAQGTVAAQSSKSLRLWQVDLSAFDADEAGGSDSSEEEGAEEPAPEVDHPERKRKFGVYAKTLEGKTVKVRPFKRVLALRTSGLTMIPPIFIFIFQQVVDKSLGTVTWTLPESSPLTTHFISKPSSCCRRWSETSTLLNLPK